MPLSFKRGDFVVFPYSGKDGKRLEFTCEVQGSYFHMGKERLTVKSPDPKSRRSMLVPADICKMAVLKKEPKPKKARRAVVVKV